MSEERARTEQDFELAEEIAKRGVAQNKSWNVPLATALTVVAILKEFGYPVKRLFIPSFPVAAPHQETIYTEEQVRAAGITYMPLNWTIQFEGSNDIEDRHSVALLRRAISNGTVSDLRRLHDSVAPSLATRPTFDNQLLTSPKVVASVQQILGELLKESKAA